MRSNLWNFSITTWFSLISSKQKSYAASNFCQEVLQVHKEYFDRLSPRALSGTSYVFVVVPHNLRPLPLALVALSLCFLSLLLLLLLPFVYLHCAPSLRTQVQRKQPRAVCGCMCLCVCEAAAAALSLLLQRFCCCCCCRFWNGNWKLECFTGSAGNESKTFYCK